MDLSIRKVILYAMEVVIIIFAELYPLKDAYVKK